jgi:uncharacterized membrane protein YdbT with pleckstrin-like domain
MTENTRPEPAYRYHGLAIYALIMGVLSLLWLLFGLPWAILAILAILGGLRAKREIDSAPYKIEGRALATGAIVAGGVGLGTAMLVLLVVLTAPPA